MSGRRGVTTRVRGSWIPRLVGIGFVILLACAGVAAYLIAGGPPATKTASVLPTRVIGTQAVSIVFAGLPSQPGGSRVPEMLLTSHSDPIFTADGPSGAEWTADQMAGGTYVFIYLPDGLCLASVASRSRPAPALVLARCNLKTSQRWLRQHQTVGASGVGYWQLRNLADGRCLTAGSTDSTTVSPPELESCQAVPGVRQLFAFLAAS
jgi:hypothetical protein